MTDNSDSANQQEIVRLNALVKSQEHEITTLRKNQNLQNTLYMIANLANSDTELSDFYAQVHRLIGKHIYCENFFIALNNQDKESIDFVYYHDSLDDETLDTLKSIPKKDIKNSLTYYAIKQGKSLLLSGQEIAKLTQEMNFKVLGIKTHSWLCVQLPAGETSLGVMVIQSYDTNISYTNNDQEMMVFVGQQLSHALQRKFNQEDLKATVVKRNKELIKTNKKLEAEIEQRIESETLQSALFEISRTPENCQTEKDLYEKLRHIISKLMHVESFYIVLVDEAEQKFHVDFIYDSVDKNVPESFPMGSGLTSYVYRKRKIIHLSKQEIIDLERQDKISHLGSYANDWLGVPLISAGNFYGIMILQSYHGDLRYSEKEIQVLSFVSTYIAEALQRKAGEFKLKTAYAELEEKSLKAEAANEAKSSFLATISHEIRTPMNGVLGMLSLLSETLMTDSQKDYVRKISNSANSLQGLLNDILDFSHLEKGKLKLEPTEFSVIEILDNLYDTFTEKIQDKQIEFYTLLSPEVALNRFGDADKLSQVLINLFSNAIKFTDSGYIKLSIQEPIPERLSFTVEDSGVGISPDEKNRVFQSFTQADGTSTRMYGGTGLGLSVSQLLVNLMNGKIELHSKPGVGSTFQFEVDIQVSKQRIDKPIQIENNLLLFTSNKIQALTWQNIAKICNSKITTLSIDEFEEKYKKPSQLKIFTHIFIDESDYVSANIFDSELFRSREIENIRVYILARNYSNNSLIAKTSKNINTLVKPIKIGNILELLSVNQSNETSKRKPGNVDSTIVNPLKDKRILIAEDNHINQQVTKELLKRVGVNVTLAENGQQAVDACIAETFDLILMDIQMPVMDGYTATEIIRKTFSKKQLPIVALTANAMKGDREKCLAHKMNDYLSKPINHSLFYKTIEKNLHEANKKDLSNADNSSEQANNNADLLYAADNQQKEFNLQQLAGSLKSEDLAKELVSIFVSSHSNDALETINLINSQKLAEAQKLIHKLKGSAGELGLYPLYEICAQINSSLKQNNRPDEATLSNFRNILFNNINDLRESASL